MTQSHRLVGRRALVTGGGHDIGAAVVRRLAAEGATVAVNYRSDAASADALVEQIRTSLRGCDPEAVQKSKTALGRWAEPEEIAAAVVFLLSPDASYLTAATLDSSGGWI